MSNNDDTFEVAATLVAAIGEASARAKAGRNYRQLLERIRELHVVLLELLLISEPNVDERTRGLAIALGNRVDELEALVGRDR